MSRQPTDQPTDEQWYLEAACRDLTVEESDAVFFPLSENRKTARIAEQEFCGRCPVRQECLSGALHRREVAGIWAGVTTRTRDRMMRNRTRIKCPVCQSRDMGVIVDTTASGADVRFSVCVSCGASWRMEPGVVRFKTEPDHEFTEVTVLHPADIAAPERAVA
jgi:WhiB family redox-sensing transcriptional regulator